MRTLLSTLTRRCLTMRETSRPVRAYFRRLRKKICGREDEDQQVVQAAEPHLAGSDPQLGATASTTTDEGISMTTSTMMTVLVYEAAVHGCLISMSKAFRQPTSQKVDPS